MRLNRSVDRKQMPGNSNDELGPQGGGSKSSLQYWTFGEHISEVPT
jgi:hypothetical protein